MKYIDISTFQGDVDFERVKQTDVKGIIVRAGYGQNNIDEKFERNMRECNRLGIPVGVYWFSYAYNPERAKKEAEYCLAAIKPYRVELPVAWDWEYASRDYALRYNPQFNAATANACLRAFCGTIEAGGYYAMLYTGKYLLRDYFTDNAAYDKWIALYPSGAPDLANPPRPCGIWQWGGSQVDGIKGNVDTDEAYHDYAKLIKSAGLNHLNDLPAEEAWARERGLITADTDLDTALTKREAVKWLYALTKGDE